MRPLLLLLAITAASAQDRVADGATRADWPHYGGTQMAWRYSALDQINTGNVKNLAPAWIFQTGDYVENLQSTPLVVDGVMYLITPRAQVFSLDAATGRLIWQYKYPTPRTGIPGSEGNFVQNRGLAVSDGKVFFGTIDNNLVALDQKTGREVWKVAVDDPRQCGCNIGAAPLVVKDKVIVGGNGGDDAHRGYLTAFYMKTGRLAWRWYVVPGPGEKGHETWKGDSWKYGGGAPWLTGSFDPELNLVYWGTGNAGSDFNDRARVGDKNKDTNLYTASVVALDADTGKLRWHYQEVPDDVWDFDSSYEVVLVDRVIRGRPRKILVHMNKSGLTFVLDRVTGEFLGVFSVPELQTWITGITEDGKLVGRKEPEVGKAVNFCPSVAGAKSWNQMAYSPRTGFIYTPTIETCNDVTATSDAPERRQRFHERRLHIHAGAQPHQLQPPGCLGPGDRQTRLELSVSVRAAGFRVSNGWRPGVLGRSGRLLLCAQCAHRRQGVELPNRRGPSRVGDFVFGEWPAVHRDSHRLARIAGWRSRRGPVPGPGVSHGVNAGGVRSAAIGSGTHAGA